MPLRSQLKSALVRPKYLYLQVACLSRLSGNRPDRNASVYLDEVKENFAGLTDRLRELCAENKPSGAT